MTLSAQGLRAITSILKYCCLYVNKHEQLANYCCLLQLRNEQRAYKELAELEVNKDLHDAVREGLEGHRDDAKARRELLRSFVYYVCYVCVIVYVSYVFVCYVVYYLCLCYVVCIVSL